jgi:hypothetical protein
VRADTVGAPLPRPPAAAIVGGAGTGGEGFLFDTGGACCCVDGLLVRVLPPRAREFGTAGPAGHVILRGGKAGRWIESIELTCFFMMALVGRVAAI